MDIRVKRVGLTVVGTLVVVPLIALGAIALAVVSPVIIWWGLTEEDAIIKQTKDGFEELE